MGKIPPSNRRCRKQKLSCSLQMFAKLFRNVTRTRGVGTKGTVSSAARKLIGLMPFVSELLKNKLQLSDYPQRNPSC